MIKRAAESSGHVFVAEEDGVFAGFACLMGKVEPEPDESTEPWGYVTDFLVRAAFRGRGIGRQLLAAAEASARAMEIKRLKADVLATNASAREFYRAGGFREYAILLVKSL
jgi:ribosomal protein S18 acetylase RimI-like enzyme